MFKLKHLLFFIIIIVAVQAYSQKLSFDKKIEYSVFKTSDNSLTINSIVKNTKVFKSIKSNNQKTNQNEIYWIRLHTENLIDSIKGDHFYLRLNSFDYGDLYTLNNKSYIQKRIGLFQQNLISKRIPFNNYYSEIKLSKSVLQNNYLYLKVKRVTFNENILNWNFKISSSPDFTNFTTKEITSLLPYLIFTGICIIAWFWSISYFFMIKSSEFLFYSLYIIFLFFYICGNKLGIYQFLFNNYYLEFLISQIMIYVTHIAYGYYIVKYLRTKIDYPIFHKLLISFIFLNIIIACIVLLFFSIQYYQGLNFINSYFLSLYYVFAIVFVLYLLYIAKNLLAHFVAIATITLCVFSLLHIIYATPNDGLYLDSFYLIIVGSTIEIIIFTFGLNYKARMELLEKFQLKQETITHKKKALRAQINPHFIFNSLSSIQNLISKNDRIASLKYLSKFSRLTRNILESSMETNVVLEDELKMLNDYLELESLRFDNSFQYKIIIDKTITPQSIEIPFLILQPFVENAIIHGLLPKETNSKELTVNIKKENNFLVCEIEDNGVGRRTSNKKERIHQNKKRSRGLEVTKQRLEAISNDKEMIKIIDKKDKLNNALGTKVIIQIPIKNE